MVVCPIELFGTHEEITSPGFVVHGFSFFVCVCVCAVGSMFTAFKGLKNCVAIAANIFLEFSPQLNLNSVPYN